MSKNLCVVLHAKDDLRMEEREIPKPKPNQLLIRVNTVGICGSDVHFWKHGAIGQFVVRKPMVLGHETSGTVAEVGADVKGFKIGDRIAIEGGIPCRMCAHCKTGVYNLCADMRFFATPPVDGSLAQYIVHDADFCFKIPDNLTMEDASLIEPLSVAVQACRRARVTIGQTILVLGEGPIGLVNLLTAKAMGATCVLVTGILESRLELAKKLGADHILNVKDMKPEQAAQQIISTLGKEPDAAVECTGFQTSIQTAIHAVKGGGTVVMVGMASDRAEIPLIEISAKELDLRGIFRYANCYQTAIDMLASGKVKLDALTRAHYKLEDSLSAFERCLKRDVIKVFIHCDEKK